MRNPCAHNVTTHITLSSRHGAWFKLNSHRHLPIMRPISIVSILALCLATSLASVVMSEQQPMSEDTPIRTTASWEYSVCGLLFNPY